MQKTSTIPIEKQATPAGDNPGDRSPQPSLLTRILREPLLHFVVLGALLFGLYFAVNGGSTIASTQQEKQIQVSAADVEFLQTTWEQQWGRSPTPNELQKLVDNYVRDEILYREALALDLDERDIIVRRRLVQKMQFLVQDVAPLPEPSDELLQAYLTEHAARYAVPGKVSFQQMYFSRELRGDRTDTDAVEMLAQLQADPELAALRGTGDRSMLPTSYTLASEQKLANTFGGSLAQEMAGVTETGWQGPFHSAYGSHLAKVTAIEPGHPATLSEVRRDVRLDWLRDKRKEQDDAFYQQLRDRYAVSIDETAIAEATQKEEK